MNKRNNIAKGVFLTRSYNNPGGVLPEHIFISNDERWFIGWDIIKTSKECRHSRK